ncbi:MAG: tetratricopeptide repeat protein, partial [Gemmatimonadales bacterium]
YRSALRQGDDEGARDLGVKILELDPDVDLDALAGPESEAESFTFEPTALAGAEQDPDGEGMGDNVVSVPGSPHSDFGGDFGDHQEGGGFAEIRDALETGEEAGGPGSGSHPAAQSEADQQDFQEITFDDLGFGEDSHPVEEDEADPLPLVYPDEGGPGLEGAGFDVDPGLVDQDLSGSLEAAWEDASDEGSEALHAQWVRLRDECRRVPKDLELAQQLVELSFRLGDKDSLVASYLTLAGCLEETGQVERSESVLRQAMALDPDHPEVLRALHGLREKPPEAGVSDDAGGFVDLASLILGEDRKEKTTRFRVAYEEPSGDEEADFARMLTQFKEKVAESFDAADVRAHHDLGTAYKEMGLLDEAVEKFQAALRASPVHLPSYELLGQTFFEKGEYTAAVRVLERALRVSTDVADDFIGIYYYLARAHEELGSNDRAVEYYDHVFALDINFMDVTERLRALR